MFFGKKATRKDQTKPQEMRDERFADVAWDEKTVNWIKEVKRFDLRLTQMTRTNVFGSIAKGVPTGGDPWQMSGIILSPKYISVSIAFDHSDGFGCFYYGINTQKM